MSTALQPTSIESVIEARLKELPFPKTTAIDPEGKTYQEVHDEQIAEIERRASKIAPVIDEATRAETQKALTALTKVRTGINRFRLDLFSPITNLKKKFDSYLGTTMDGGLQARIRAIEIPLEESMAKYDRELERIRQEGLRKIEDRNKARAAYVVGAGMTFTGAEYKMDELVLWPADLNTWNDDAFENWKVAKLQPALQAKAEREKAAREAAEQAEREAKAKAAELEAALAKQKADEERLASERAELEKEKSDIMKAKNELRAAELVAIGARLSEIECVDPRGVRSVVLFAAVDGWKGESLEVSKLSDWNEEQWAAVKEEVREAKERYDERIRRSNLNNNRSRILQRLVYHRYDGEQVWTCGEATVTDAQLSTMSDEEWVVVLAKFHNEEERLSSVPNLVLPPGGPDFTKDINPPADLPLGVATEENPDFAPQMQAVHVAPAPVEEPMDVELTVEARTLVAEARLHAARQDSAAYVLSAGDGQFLAFGTADQIRELLGGQ